MARKCGNCGKEGHYRVSCGKQPNETKLPHSSLKDQGRQILAEQRKKVDRVEDETGNIPRKGLWVISQGRNKVYGKIQYVKRNGTVVWQDVYGAFIETDQHKLLDNECSFVELESTMLKWEVVNL